MIGTYEVVCREQFLQHGEVFISEQFNWAADAVEFALRQSRHYAVSILNARSGKILWANTAGFVSARKLDPEMIAGIV